MYVSTFFSFNIQFYNFVIFHIYEIIEQHFTYFFNSSNSSSLVVSINGWNIQSVILEIYKETIFYLLRYYRKIVSFFSILGLSI